MKPLHGGTKAVLKVGTFVPTKTDNNILPGRAFAEGTQGVEGFRASMIVSRQRIALTAMRSSFGMPGPDGAISAAPKLPA